MDAVYGKGWSPGEPRMQYTFESKRTGIEIRVATEHDLESLTDALGPGVGAAQVKRRLEESTCGFRIMLVAVKADQVTGTVSIGGSRFQRRGSLRIFALDVGSAFRRNGVGTELVKAVEAIAADRKLDEVNLEVATDNENAIRLYRRLGFRKCDDVVMDRWQRERGDGSSEMIEAPSFVMVKRLV